MHSKAPAAANVPGVQVIGKAAGSEQIEPAGQSWHLETFPKLKDNK